MAPSNKGTPTKETIASGLLDRMTTNLTTEEAAKLYGAPVEGTPTKASLRANSESSPRELKRHKPNDDAQITIGSKGPEDTPTSKTTSNKALSTTSKTNSKTLKANPPNLPVYDKHDMHALDTISAATIEEIFPPRGLVLSDYNFGRVVTSALRAIERCILEMFVLN
ncbi:hypothetical protein MMC22_007127 [Lobaria immixta]|nr:hypothetical protein [Lobaria immixta]